VDRSLAARASGRPEAGRIVLRGDAPSRTEPIQGCPFHARCHRARPVCAQSRPAATHLDPDRLSFCHFTGEMEGPF
jgi:oligopeptide/dipeptide ABC transporter ATP-binding protein